MAPRIEMVGLNGCVTCESKILEATSNDLWIIEIRKEEAPKQAIIPEPKAQLVAQEAVVEELKEVDTQVLDTTLEEVDLTTAVADASIENEPVIEEEQIPAEEKSVVTEPQKMKVEQI